MDSTLLRTLHYSEAVEHNSLNDGRNEIVEVVLPVRSRMRIGAERSLMGESDWVGKVMGEEMEA